LQGSQAECDRVKLLPVGIKKKKEKRGDLEKGNSHIRRSGIGIALQFWKNACFVRGRVLAEEGKRWYCSRHCTGSGSISNSKGREAEMHTSNWVDFKDKRVVCLHGNSQLGKGRGEKRLSSSKKADMVLQTGAGTNSVCGRMGGSGEQPIHLSDGKVWVGRTAQERGNCDWG